MQASSLNCPACGAAISRDSTECRFCHALLQTVACPQCFGMMFVGTKFCPYCGAPAEQIDVGKPTTKACPRCNVPLQEMSVAKTPLDECTQCGGIWVDVASFDHICSIAQMQTAATGLNVPPPPLPPLEANVRYLHCPQCAQLMNRINYAGRSGIVTNVCKPHGIWLDRDQMREIIAFIRSGGLERSRQIEIEHLQRQRHEQQLSQEEPADDGFTTPLSIGGSIGSADGFDLLKGIAWIITHIRL